MMCMCVLPLALQMYGCRVIQKALESIPTEMQVNVCVVQVCCTGVCSTGVCCTGVLYRCVTGV